MERTAVIHNQEDPLHLAIALRCQAVLKCPLKGLDAISSRRLSVDPAAEDSVDGQVAQRAVTGVLKLIPGALPRHGCGRVVWVVGSGPQLGRYRHDEAR